MIQYAQPFAIEKRILLGEEIRSIQSDIAERVTDEFFERHPDWKEQYGMRGRIRGIEDANFHLDFLCGAVESGTEETFGEYVRWAVRMLEARKIGAEFFAENLEQIRDALEGTLRNPGKEIALRILTEGARLARSSRNAEPAPPEASTAQQVYMQAVLMGNRRAALNTALELLDKGHSISSIYTEVLQRTLYEVGALWEKNKISVAEEHMATAITQFVIAQLYQRLKPAGTSRGRVVITGVQGEQHQVGANMVADVLEEMGWDVRFLGTNMPHAGILNVVEEHRPQLVGISATMLFNVPQVRRLVSELRSRFGDASPRIVVGGSAFRMAPELYKEIGADGFASDLASLTEQLSEQA